MNQAITLRREERKFPRFAVRRPIPGEHNVSVSIKGTQRDIIDEELVGAFVDGFSLEHTQSFVLNRSKVNLEVLTQDTVRNRGLKVIENVVLCGGTRHGRQKRGGGGSEDVR